MAPVNWPGQSGGVYSYEIYPIGAIWNNVPGNYIFARQVAPGRWEALYIGQTESFSRRLPYHEKLSCARGRGGTHIHAHVSSDDASRLSEERDLVRLHNPPCNG